MNINDEIETLATVNRSRALVVDAIRLLNEGSTAQAAFVLGQAFCHLQAQSRRLMQAAEERTPDALNHPDPKVRQQALADYMARKRTAGVDDEYAE